MFSTPSLAIFFTCCYQMDSNLANLEATVDVGYILEFLSVTTSGITCTMSISSLTRLCTDIIQVRWKTFTSFCSKFIPKKQCTKFCQYPPSFVEILQKTFLDSFFLDSVYKLFVFTT